MRYNNYHKHTHYSNIYTPDSIVKPVDYAKKALELGHTTISTVEHGFSGNIFEYLQIAKQYDLKCIFGAEFYYVKDRFEKDRSNTHLLLLARTNQGFYQIQHLISEANLTGYYFKPRIDRSLLLQLKPEDIFITSTCTMSYIGKFEDYEEEFIQPILTHFQENFFLEIQAHPHIHQKEYNLKIKKLHQKYQIPLIHACDSHYIEPEQALQRQLFLKGKNIEYPEETSFILDYPDAQTIFKRYEQQQVFSEEQVIQALTNTLVLDLCEEIEFNQEVKMPSIYPGKDEKQKMKIFREIIISEWENDKKEIPKNEHPRYIEAMKEEFDIIKKTNMVDYFLINYQIIKKAKEKGGVLTRTGRGSAPSFYINKLLGFTEIDRLQAPVTLYPSRFMSISRILESKSLPDIDFNTADPEPFIQASKEILGENHVYPMVAYGKMQQSEAFRNYCRALKLNVEQYNDIAKNIEAYHEHPKWGAIIKESEIFIGVIDRISPHPCAVLLYSESIPHHIGLIRLNTGNKQVYCAVIDSTTSDHWKFLKNDYLTVAVWKIIAKTFQKINQPIPSIRQLTKMIDNNPHIWDVYTKGLTATLNQTGTLLGTQQIKEYQPTSIKELTAWVSAIRPAFASLRSTFLQRKPFKYDIPAFDQLLQESDNFIMYQENIMKVLVYAGFREDETYDILKAIAKKKKGIIEQIEHRFISQMKIKLQNDQAAKEIWTIILDAAGYSFNASHAYATALDSLYGAYLKTMYPKEYFVTILNIYQQDAEMTRRIKEELHHFHLSIQPIQFGKSHAEYTSESNNPSHIYKGLGSVKYMNQQSIDHLIMMYNHNHLDFYELLMEITEKTCVNKRQIEILIKLNYFYMFGGNAYLYRLYQNFFAGEQPYKKTLKAQSKEKRLAQLKNQLHHQHDDEKKQNFQIEKQICFEKEYLGYVETPTCTENSHHYVILAIDTTYTPKITCYHLHEQKETIFKINKQEFLQQEAERPFEIGEKLIIYSFITKDKKRKIADKWVSVEGSDQYLQSYIRIFDGVQSTSERS